MVRVPVERKMIIKKCGNDNNGTRWRSEKETSKTIVDGNVKAEYRVDKENWSFKPIGDANRKVVLLTFDDAPDKYSLKIAQTLKRLEVPAIFFVNGHFLENDENKAMLKEIHEMGFLSVIILIPMWI